MKFNQPLPTGRVDDGSNCKSYQMNLVPLPSIFRPHCLAQDWLKLWHPSSPRSNRISNVEISESDLERILDVINVSWAKGTKEVYGASLLIYHVFCDSCNISEEDRIPASPILIISFIASCVGSYSDTMLANYVFAVCAWHILHGLPWNMDDMQVKSHANWGCCSGTTLLQASQKGSGYSGSNGKSFPQTWHGKATGCGISKLLLNSFLFSCTYWRIYTSYTEHLCPTQHVKPSNISNQLDQNNLEVMVFHLPKAKCSSEGEDVFWSQQNGITDPKASLENHFWINNPPVDGPLFTYRHAKGLHPLTKKVFLDRINRITSMLGEDSLKGHGIHIGGTLEFQLRGMPFDVMKSLGRWTSEAFMLYLHQHATIIVPYI